MVRLILSIVFFVVLALFIALNAQYQTSINLFGYKLENISIVAVIIVTMAVGILYSFTIYLTNYFAKNKKKKLKSLRVSKKKRMNQNHAEIKNGVPEAAAETSPETTPKVVSAKTREPYSEFEGIQPEVPLPESGKKGKKKKTNPK